MEEALEILARVGTDNAPTLAELTTARDTIARELHQLRAAGGGDLEALMTLRETYQTAAAAVTEAEEAEANAAQQVDEVLDGIPNPDEVTPTEEPEPVNASGRVLSVAEAVERLGLRSPAATAPVEPEPTLADTSTTVMLNGERRDDASWREMSLAFGDATSRSSKQGKDRVVRIETSFAPERTLTGRIADDTRLVDSFISPTAVSAAGGCCVLPEPIYENPVLSSTARPIRDGLPSMGAARGAFTFFPAVCLPDQGAALWTCEDDAAVDPADETTWKQCLDVPCDEADEVLVDAIYSCLTIGNFNQRFAPEQWQAYLQAVAAYQARIAEVALFDKMRNADGVTTHTLDATGSLYVTLLNGVTLAANTIRQDQRYIDVQLTLVLAEWVRDAVRADLRARRLDCADTVETTQAAIAQALSEDGINVIWSPDIDPIEPGVQVDGPLTPYPDTASAMLFPEGSFSFLDGGTLDLGTEIRDHDLNRKNQLAAFAESFEGLLARFCNAKALDIPVEVCDSAPCPAIS